MYSVKHSRMFLKMVRVDTSSNPIKMWVQVLEVYLIFFSDSFSIIEIFSTLMPNH